MIIRDPNRALVESMAHNPSIEKRILLRQGEVPHLTVFAEGIFPPGCAATTPHCHFGMVELFLVRSGQGGLDSGVGTSTPASRSIGGGRSGRSAPDS